MGEQAFYHVVQRFLRERLGCFSAEQLVGIAQNSVQGTIDVAGIRHVGGDLRGDVELIACEVKDGEPFLKSAGQARAYGVMAHRCYLASNQEFTIDQRRVAEHLGIGLIEISGDEKTRCSEVQSAALHEPNAGYLQELVEKGFGLAKCVVCASFFSISEDTRWKDPALIVKDGSIHDIATAHSSERAFLYWVAHQQELRKDKRTGERRDGALYDRRFVCADCIQALQLGQGRRPDGE